MAEPQANAAMGMRRNAAKAPRDRCPLCGGPHGGNRVANAFGDEAFVCASCQDALAKPQARPKYGVGDKVAFDGASRGKGKVGVVEIVDFGGAFELDEHSYDIFVAEENTLYKHIPESSVEGTMPS